MLRLSALLAALCLAPAAFGQVHVKAILLDKPAGSTFAIPGTASVDAAGRRIFVPVSYYPLDEGAVVVIDAANDKVVATIPVPYPSSGAVYNPVNKHLYVATLPRWTKVGPGPGDWSVSVGGVLVIDPATGALLKQVKEIPESTQLAVNPATNRIYASQWRYPFVEVIDGAKDEWLTRIALPEDMHNPGPLAVHAQTNRVYLTLANARKLASGSAFPLVTLDGAKNEVASITEGEFGVLAIDPKRGQLWAGAVFTPTLSVVSLATGAVLASKVPLAPSKNPYTSAEYVGGLAYDPRMDVVRASKLISATFDQLDPVTRGVLGTVTVSSKPGLFGVAVNPATGKIYLSQRDTFIGFQTPGAIFILRAECEGEVGDCEEDVAIPKGEGDATRSKWSPGRGDDEAAAKRSRAR